MLKSAIFFLPCFVSLIWGVMMLFSRHKDLARKVLTALLLVSAVYFLADAFFVTPLDSFEDYKILIRVDVLSQFSTLMLIPLLLMYVLVAQGRKFSWGLAYLSLLPAFCQGVASTVIYAVMGFDNAAAFMQSFDALGAFPPEYDHPIYHAHYVVCQNAYNVLLALEVLGGIAFLALSTYKHRKEKVSIVSVLFLILLAICVLRISLGREFLIANLGLSSVLTTLLSLAMFLICYFATGIKLSVSGAGGASGGTGHQPSPAVAEVAAAPAIPVPNQPFHRPLDVPDPPAIEAPTEPEGPSKPHNLLESFIVYISKERPYLDPDFSVTDVCEALHTNRTYISELMANNFKMPFRDYVGVLRISLAKRLLRENPNRTLEDIAADSGFASSSQFVKKFKEITGTTPRAWLSIHS